MQRACLTEMKAANEGANGAVFGKAMVQMSPPSCVQGAIFLHIQSSTPVRKLHRVPLSRSSKEQALERC